MHAADEGTGMRRLWAIAAATALACGIGGCGLTPDGDGPQLTVAGPSAAVESFIRQQGAHRPTRATTFPQTIGEGRATARVLMPTGTPAATMEALSREASAAGLRSAVVAGG